MTYTSEQLIEALYKEYEYLCHDDFDPDEDPTPEEYLKMIKSFSYEELVSETGTDEHFTLSEYLDTWR